MACHQPNHHADEQLHWVGHRHLEKCLHTLFYWNGTKLKFVKSFTNIARYPDAIFRAKRKMIAPRRDNPRNLRRTFPFWSSLIGQEQLPLLSGFHLIFVHRDYQLQFQVIFNYLHLLRQSMASMAIPRKMTPTHPMANFSLNNGIMTDWSLFSQQNIFWRQTKKHNLSIKKS